MAHLNVYERSIFAKGYGMSVGCYREHVGELICNIVGTRVKREARSSMTITYPDLETYSVGAARTRAPAATNYDVHAPRRKMLGSPAP